MTLDLWLKQLPTNSIVIYGISPTDHYELIKFGVSALILLPLHKQALICASFGATYH